MKNSKLIKAAYHLTELAELMTRFPPRQLESLAALIGDAHVLQRTQETLARLSPAHDAEARRRPQFAEFRFENVMRRLRSAVMEPGPDGLPSDLDWLLKTILCSPALFGSVRELDNFLSNMTGLEHSTKSTGRDRVVDWYFKHISEMPSDEQNLVYYRIARHVFAQGKSDYREWKNLFLGR